MFNVLMEYTQEIILMEENQALENFIFLMDKLTQVVGQTTVSEDMVYLLNKMAHGIRVNSSKDATMNQVLNSIARIK